MRKREGTYRAKIRWSGINSILAHAAALMLTGVPAVVCETVLDEVVTSVKKSIERIKV